MSNKWAQKLVDEVRLKWEDVERQFDSPVDRECWRSAGFCVFSSPVVKNAELVIVSFNPNKEEPIQDHQTIPNSHIYFNSDYPLAKAMKDIFSQMGLMDILKRSVRINLYFFRTKNIVDWKEMRPASLREDLEYFCEEKVQRIIKEINPKLILTEGLEAYDHLKKILPIKDNEKNLQQSCNRVFAKHGNLIGIIHPTDKRTRSLFLDTRFIITKHIKQALFGDGNPW